MGHTLGPLTETLEKDEGFSKGPMGAYRFVPRFGRKLFWQMKLRFMKLKNGLVRQK